MITHSYIRYAHALLCVENNLDENVPLLTFSTDLIYRELENGLNHFRVKARAFEGVDEVEFDYCNLAKGDTNKGIYLSGNILCTDKAAGNFYKANIDAIAELKKTTEVVQKYFAKNQTASMSSIPTSGEFLGFSTNGGISRNAPIISTHEYLFGLITGSTPTKPFIVTKIYAKKRYEYRNATIIPDLPLKDLINFIRLFKGITTKKLDGLMKGRVYKEVDKNGKIKSQKPMRPYLFNGNFPHAPKSTSLGAIALLGAIGEIAKEEEFHSFGESVLNSLKEAQMYMIEYGSSSSFRYNHHIVEMAKENKLSSIVDSIYYSVLYREGIRNSKNRDEYQKFDLFTSRFLMLFNSATFRDFLAFRAEYPVNVQELLITYFTKMETINLEIVKSARAFGKWLNLAAFITAKNEISANSQNYNQKLRDFKAKVLIELESAAFSAKTTDALFAQLMTRVGRLCGMDAPEGATLFMETALSNQISLEKTKNMVVAFMRLRNKQEAKEIPPVTDEDEDSSGEDESVSNDAKE
jgi:CRISPR-associated protein Cas8c/Csp2